MTFDADGFDRPLVPPTDERALLELAERAPMHPLPSVVLYQEHRLADGDTWLWSKLRWLIHRAHDASSVRHITYQRPG